MTESNKKLALQITLQNDKVIEINFTTFEELDKFTVNFNSKEEISDFLFENENYAKKIEIIHKHIKDKNKQEEPKIYPVKYKGDNFDIPKLKIAYYNYLINNREKLKNPEKGIKYLIRNNANTSYMEISSNQIFDAIDAEFKRGYKPIRDIYFKLKEMNVKIYIKPENVEIKKEKNKFMPDSVDDTIDTLIRMMNNSEEEHDYAVEELSLYSLEELKKARRRNEGIPKFDGLTKENDDVEKLVDKISILSEEKRQKLVDEICEIRDKYSTKKVRRK